MKKSLLFGIMLTFMMCRIFLGLTGDTVRIQQHKHHQQPPQPQQKQQKDKPQKISADVSSSRKKLAGKATSDETCPSHSKIGNIKNEHSPLVFGENNLMVCRSPKVGSSELRSVAVAYETNTTFQPPTTNLPYKGIILARVKSEEEFHRYLYGEDVTRIMFVRHPIHRILSGFLQSARSIQFWRLHGLDENELDDLNDDEKLRLSPQSFRKWVLDPRKFFFKYYQSQCDANSAKRSLHGRIQHWAPPQHCRCGMYDCGVQWDVYKVEEHSIQSVLKEYLPQRFLPPANVTQILHSKEYSKKDYLTDDILKVLNLATREELEVLGYAPLTVNDV